MSNNRLPVVSGFEVVKALTRAGCVIRRQRSSHVVLQKDRRVFTVPLHRELKKGTLNAIIKQAGLTREEFLEYLR